MLLTGVCVFSLYLQVRSVSLVPLVPRSRVSPGTTSAIVLAVASETVAVSSTTCTCTRFCTLGGEERQLGVLPGLALHRGHGAFRPGVHRRALFPLFMLDASTSRAAADYPVQ